MEMIRLYRLIEEELEHCYYVSSKKNLSDDDVHKLCEILADGFIVDTVKDVSQFVQDHVVEVGTILNRITPWSTNMVSICHAIGLNDVVRVERACRYFVHDKRERTGIIERHCDRMTEMVYEEPLMTFDTGMEPEDVYDVDLIGGGPDALKSVPGISMDGWDRQHYYDYFVGEENRNPTIVEILDLNNANSEHSRHGYFGAKLIIDGVEQEKTLFDLVWGTLLENFTGSVIAFKDNSSVIWGHDIETLVPENPGEASPLLMQDVTYHPLLTAETHNFPTGVAPFPGAETGTGGRIRDVLGTGKGGFVIAGTAGYCVGNLNIPGYKLPWEEDLSIPNNLATPLQIEIDASNGASDYGNKFGEPVISGFTRSFDMRLSNSRRWGFVKPIMFTGGIGQIDGRITEKSQEEEGMLIVQIGGPAYRVGFGGGAASSMMQGEQSADLDFDAVQRGDGEMAQKMSRVIRACNEMGDKTLIDVNHDQGAGGPANVLKEMVEKLGGIVDIRLIKVGDPTMSILEIYVAEYQERMGFLIRQENIEKFKAICVREKVNCEVLGEVTGNMHFVVRDSRNGTTPVNMDLSKVLGGMPQKVYEDAHVDSELMSLELPSGLKVVDVLKRVLRLVSVGSKRFLTNKVDRSVTGLIAGQQCCGSLQTPLADVAVVAQSYFGTTGIASSIGEQSIKMLVDPAAGARMAVGEALTNLAFAKINDLDQVKCSANWMWAPKLSGEGAALGDAVVAMCEVMASSGIAVDGGKDSLSMATLIDNETVKSPRELVISLYAAMSNIRKIITPDIKEVGRSCLIHIDLAPGKKRMGGSAIAQVYKQIGNVSPDVDDPKILRGAFLAMQKLIDQGWLLSGHDISDGGLIGAVLEMAFAGNCGLELFLKKGFDEETAIEHLFAEELGFVIEVREFDVSAVAEVLNSFDLEFSVIGSPIVADRVLVMHDREIVLDEQMFALRALWEETSYQIELLQASPECVFSERNVLFNRKGPEYHLSFSVEPINLAAMRVPEDMKPKVAILREEGSNSDREMAAAFYAAGFSPWDVTMTDLLNGKVDLADFRGLAAVGGFSYADVPESAKGWAVTIKYRLWEMFRKFLFQRDDTFSFGVCNGCQLFGLLGIVPWEGIPYQHQPRFVHNKSGRFESRWTTVKIMSSNSIMLRGMEGMQFGIHVAHGEGRLLVPNLEFMEDLIRSQLTPIRYVDDVGRETEKYPFNPNGSPHGFASLCADNGRHLAMMPHPERAFLDWQCHYIPEELKQKLQKIGASPWLKMFQNAYEWCVEN